MNRKTVSGIMLTLLLVGIFTLALNIQSTKAETKIIRMGCLKWDRVPYEPFEFAIGTAYDEARAELADPNNFGPGGVVDCEFTILPPVHDITEDNLRDVDIFWAAILLNDDPLTADEQQVILDYVKDGGKLVIIADGSVFSFGPNSVAAPFGAHWDGVSWIDENPTITDNGNPIIDGPFGTVETIGHASEGSIDSLGPHADEIASNVNGSSIAWIEPRELSSDSGAVFFFSDVNEFTSNDTPWGPGIDRFDNRVLFRNLFAYLALMTPRIDATIDIDSDTLNLRSKGKWITTHIELPEGYDVNDINVTTILLNDAIPAEIHPTDIGDYDEDGIPDLMVKFDRAEVMALLSVGEAILTITGKVNGSHFEGSDTIRVIGE